MTEKKFKENELELVLRKLVEMDISSGYALDIAELFDKIRNRETIKDSRFIDYKEVFEVIISNLVEMKTKKLTKTRSMN